MAKQPSSATRRTKTAAKMRPVSGLVVAERSVLPDVSGEICETYNAHCLYVAVLGEAAAAAD